jgi:hypothetical protein
LFITLCRLYSGAKILYPTDDPSQQSGRAAAVAAGVTICLDWLVVNVSDRDLPKDLADKRRLEVLDFGHSVSYISLISSQNNDKLI